MRRPARAHEDPATEALLAATEWQRQLGGELKVCALSSGQPIVHDAIDDAWYQSVATSEAHLALLRRLHFGAMRSVPLYCGE